MSKDDEARKHSASTSFSNVKTNRRRVDTAEVGTKPHIGRALRSVYEDTVDEAIPDEMLDLLGRLE